MYLLHPSRELNRHFHHRPYQGVDPSTATFLFIGLDANYDEKLEHSLSFSMVLEYHKDGVTFWRKYGVHHPFLLPEYRGDGRRYHRTFAKIGFGPEHAELVSFAELLPVPTVGRSKLTVEDLDASHLRMLHRAIFSGKAKHVFISAGVARLMHASKAFQGLERKPVGSGPLRVYFQDPHRTVYCHLHFSNYGKFQRQLEAEAGAIGALLNRAS